ncbi:hypothetical protein KFE25_011623 [Diacronema lutheri]|uniref:Uncharacterized protein n=1 Tax=Diacronema lutheri TaxID=2081491 RepID=A0A8J6CC56_DIALT|nr:hypothetical protein KFE25_011623 [Diacronema lutheri]
MATYGWASSSGERGKPPSPLSANEPDDLLELVTIVGARDRLTSAMLGAVRGLRLSSRASALGVALPQPKSRGRRAARTAMCSAHGACCYAEARRA